jgi:hypothetical protein
MIATETVWQVAKWQSRFWKSINPKTMDPSSRMYLLRFFSSLLLIFTRQLSRMLLSPLKVGECLL